MKKHPLELAKRPRKAQLIAVKSLYVGQSVVHDGKKTVVISIYPEKSPLAGFILVAGHGNPILATTVHPFMI